MQQRLNFAVLTVQIAGIFVLLNSAAWGEEYCEYETFSPSCASDEVILITEAVYGRMKTGKCIPDTYSDLGCSTNVQTVLSQQCSGRQSCSFQIVYLVINHQGNCPPSATRSYLEVSFTCNKVIVPNVQKCQSLTPIPVPNVGVEGYIASWITQKTGCGDQDNPWLLTVDEGQRINITLIDFTSNERNDNNEEDGQMCVVYATIRNENAAVRNNVCGGGPKKVIPVFLSAANIIEVRLLVKTLQQPKAERHFLLKYTVEGCSDPDLPDTMWVKRFPYEAVVGCKTGSQVSWLLKCVRGVWEGQVGICSSSAASVPVLAQPTNKEYAVNVAESKAVPNDVTIFSEPDEWYVALLREQNLFIIAGTVVFISVLFFLLGVICIWSKYAKRTRPPMHVDHLTYGCKDYSYSPPLPPSYDLHPSTRHSMPSAIRATTYAFSDTSSTYNTINQQRLSTRDHIYESTFSPNIVTVREGEPGEDTTSEHKYFVLDPNYVLNK